MPISQKVASSINQFTKWDENQLLAELGHQLESIEHDFNSADDLTAAKPAAPALDKSQLAGPTADKLKQLGLRFMQRFNRTLYSIICDPNDPDNAKIRVAASEGVEKLGLVIAGVLAAHFAWLPAIVVVVTSLLLKRFGKDAYREACAIWKEQSGL